MTATYFALAMFVLALIGFLISRRKPDPYRAPKPPIYPDPVRGSVWVQGEYIHYIDEFGNRRAVTGKRV